MTMAMTRLITADELLEMDLEPGRYDLIDGALYHLAPAGGGHGQTTLMTTLPVGNYVVANDFGIVFAAETGFILDENPDVVVARTSRSCGAAGWIRAAMGAVSFA
jgi:Uma2 family endonuclease